MKRCYGVVVILLAFNACVLGNTFYPVQNGQLDLRKHNWNKDGVVNVMGYWEFYWNKLYTPSFINDSLQHDQKQFALVPDFWNKYITDNKFDKHGFGYATYHVKILCPQSTEPLLLRLLTVQGAYSLFINGKKVAVVGTPDSVESQAKTNLKPITVKALPENNVLDIVLQVSNFDSREGGLWDVVKIGTRHQIQTQITRNVAFDFIIAGMFFLAFVYNLIQYCYFPKRYALLSFCALCFIIFMRILVTEDIPLNYLWQFNWQTVRRLEYISLYLSVPLMCLFSYFLFPKDFSRKILYFILPVSGVFVLTSLFTNYYTFTYPVRYYQVFMILSAFYGLYVYVTAFMRKRSGSVLFITGFIIFLATIINDVLYSDLIINSVPVFYIGLLLFVFLLSVILAKQFSQTFSNLEIVNKQLAKANAKLEVMNSDIHKKNDQLNRINQELDIFVDRTSHDLRSPLSSIAGVTYLMENETNLETLHDYAGLQQRTLQRMDNLIKDIIDFSKNKKLQLTLGEVDFATLVRSSVEDHSHAKNASLVKINIKVLQQRKFISDERCINTIINNLISNAIKYADLKKAEPKIDLIVVVGNHNTEIIVTDNGIGIEEKHLEKIFTMFYRATSNASGTGLGLYIIKQTVEKLDGEISITSKKGEGTAIKIILPDKSR